MAIEVKIPEVGESVQEAILSEWFVQDGASVAADDPLFVIETDKVTLEVTAEVAGVLKILVPAGETVAIGAVVAQLDAAAEAAAASAPQPEPVEAPPAPAKEATPAAPMAAAAVQTAPTEAQEASAQKETPFAPAVRRLIAEKNLDPNQINGTGPGGRITKGDVLLFLEQAPAGMPETCVSPAELETDAPPAEVRKAMTPIRKRIAARLVAAKQNSAMLTTFNDIDIGKVMAERAKYK